MKREITIIGLVVDERASHAPQVQEVLTRYGSHILSRSGIPAPDKEKGIITLTMETSAQERAELEQDFKQIHGLELKTMNFAVEANEFSCSC